MDSFYKYSLNMKHVQSSRCLVNWHQCEAEVSDVVLFWTINRSRKKTVPCSIHHGKIYPIRKGPLQDCTTGRVDQPSM